MTFPVPRRFLAALLVLGVAFGAAPRSVWAADSAPPAAPLAASVTHAARTVPLATAPTTAARRAVSKDAGQAHPDDAVAGSGAFFTRPLGIAMLGIVAAGTSYAIYSASHDRIRSPNR